MKAVSHFLSVLLIPLLVPLYLFAIILGSFPSLLTTDMRQDSTLLLLGVIVFTVLLPFAVVFALYKMKIISSLSLFRREDRYIPQAVTCVSYSLFTVLLVTKWGMTNVLSLTMIANVFSAVAITVITRFWKISTHSSGAIGMLSILFLIYLKHPATTFFIPLLIIATLCIGVSYARIYLKAHTVSQVFAGAGLGIAIGVPVFYFLA